MIEKKKQADINTRSVSFCISKGGLHTMKKIVLTGGGTAGHVTPNIALIPELKKQG